MFDKIDLILKFVAFASLSIVTMVSFDSVKKLHRILGSKKILHYSILVMWISGAALIFLEGYLTSVSKSQAIQAQKNQNTAQQKIIEAQSETNEALAKQGEIHTQDELKSDNGHKNDSTYYTSQNNELRNIINKLLYTSNRTLDTTTKTIAEVKKIKIPPVEPYIDLTNDETVKINPYVDFRNDSAIFTITLQNFKDSPARNIKFMCIFINPQTNDYYLGGGIGTFNENMTLMKDEAITLPFASYLPQKMPNAFYMYVKITYTDLKDSLQQPFERVYLRNANNYGKLALNATENDFKATKHDILLKYPSLK